MEVFGFKEEDDSVDRGDASVVVDDDDEVLGILAEKRVPRRRR